MERRCVQLRDLFLLATQKPITVPNLRSRLASKKGLRRTLHLQLCGCNSDHHAPLCTTTTTTITTTTEFCDEMKPEADDVVVLGKRGLDAFPGTELEEKLKEHGIEHVVLGGFLTNCCVESTMRTAYEKGYDVITLSDCCACSSLTAQAAAAGPDGTFGMFSTQKTAEEFTAMLAA